MAQRMGNIGRMVMVERDELDALLAVARDWLDLANLDADELTQNRVRDMITDIRARLRITGGE